MRPPLSARDLFAASARDGPIELIWSDAMWEPSSSRPAQGGFVVLAPEEPYPVLPEPKPVFPDALSLFP